MVLDWFQTEEGQAYLNWRLDRDMERYSEEENLVLQPEVPSEEMLANILKKNKMARLNCHLYSNSRNRRWLSVAIVLIICSVLAGTGYILVNTLPDSGDGAPEVTYRTITTFEDQHRLVTLGDDTQIRLNSNSSLVLPETFSDSERTVTLTGEAFFSVSSDENRPFLVQVEGALIRVLGTEFNVKVDDTDRVQVAVSEGRVSLSGSKNIEGTGAILTENTFAQYHVDSGEILIEQTPVLNYLSWISGDLYFQNEPLWGVSRYLERLYGVSVRFETESLRDYSISANVRSRRLTEVLDIITQTLGITYEHDEQNKSVLFTADGEVESQ